MNRSYQSRGELCMNAGGQQFFSKRNFAYQLAKHCEFSVRYQKFDEMSPFVPVNYRSKCANFLSNFLMNFHRKFARTKQN